MTEVDAPGPPSHAGDKPDLDEAAVAERQFFRDAFEEVLADAHEFRTVKGPYYGDFNKILGDATERLRALDPNLPREALIPASYQDPETQRYTRRLGTTARSRIKILASRKQQAITDLTKDKLYGDFSQQAIPPGTFDIPPYARQENSGFTGKTCTMANFRMLFAGITGHDVEHAVVQDSLEELFSSQDKSLRLLADEEYLRVFRTSIFKKAFPTEVQAVSFLGTDFKTLAGLATALRARVPDAQIFCMVNVESEYKDALAGSWHNCILLSADEKDVIVHDPSIDHGQASRAIPKDRFIWRWAQAYLHSHLIIAAGES